MPQMGESIAEGTIVRWIKKVGDAVDRDEPLFEISTDKVDAEIPSPAAGVLLQIRVNEGETVPVESVVGLIGAAGEAVGPAKRSPAARPPRRTAAAPGSAGPDAAAERTSSCRPPCRDGSARRLALSRSQRRRRRRGAAAALDDLRRRKSSPVVRRIAHDHNIDIEALTGSGIGGRVTKRDILGYIERIESPRAGAARWRAGARGFPRTSPARASR